MLPLGNQVVTVSNMESIKAIFVIIVKNCGGIRSCRPLEVNWTIQIVNKNEVLYGF